MAKEEKFVITNLCKKNEPDPSGEDSWYIMTNLSGNITLTVAPLYSLRNWIEYGFKQVKNELGWADYRLTDYSSIEKWWEIVLSSYFLVSIQANYFNLQTVQAESKSQNHDTLIPHMDNIVSQFNQHCWWEQGTTWKSALNNLRLIIQPYIFYCLIYPWLQVFKIPGMKRCFLKLIGIMNHWRGLVLDSKLTPEILILCAC